MYICWQNTKYSQTPGISRLLVISDHGIRSLSLSLPIRGFAIWFVHLDRLISQANENESSERVVFLVQIFSETDFFSLSNIRNFLLILGNQTLLFSDIYNNFCFVKRGLVSSRLQEQLLYLKITSCHLSSDEFNVLNFVILFIFTFSFECLLLNKLKLSSMEMTLILA